MSYMMDFYGAPSKEKALAALGTKVNYPAYIFIRESEDGTTGKLAFVDQGNVLKMIEGENKKQVVNVDALPEVANGDVETLYIVDGIVYVFDGEQYKPQYVDHTAELEALTERVDTLEEKVKVLEEAPKAEDCGFEPIYEKVKYEISDVPVGTLVDYREDEIRVMCPADVEWTKQNVGAGGDANTNYMTLKTYAPNDDIVGYRETLNGEVDAEVLTDLKTDEYGRKYQPTWLALAKYDETTGWAYYGANSNVEHYIGFDYQIDWYNADGIMVASDSIRINLSNEECHSTIEPYYVSELLKELEAMTEKVTALEEADTEIVQKVTTLEKEIGNTFTELE